MKPSRLAAYRIGLNEVLFYALLAGLFGSVTNLVFVSPLPSLVCLAVFPWYLAWRDALVVPRFVFYLYVFFGYSLLGILTYHPASLGQFAFYRYDGNFIISYAPLLLIPYFRYSFTVEKVFKRFLVFATVLNGMVFVATLLATRFAVLTDWSNPATYFHGLFKSTNAAGGFLSILLSLNLLIALKERRKKWFVALGLNSLFLLATTSRGSMLGLGIGFLFFYLDRYDHRRWIWAGIAAICLVQGYVLTRTYPIFDQYIRQADLTVTGLNDYLTPLFGQVNTKSANLLIRAIDTWPRGLDCFLQSPFVGTGFGSVNDVPLRYQGIPHLLSFNAQPVKIFDDAHAHHSYLHILGEQGLIGLAVFLLFWLGVYRYLKRQAGSVVRDFLLVSFFNLSIMSFTEHRITSPSNALPFVIALCLFMMQNNRLGTSGRLLEGQNSPFEGGRGMFGSEWK